MFLFILSLILLVPLTFLLTFINETISPDELGDMGIRLENSHI